MLRSYGRIVVESVFQALFFYIQWQSIKMLPTYDKTKVGIIFFCKVLYDVGKMTELYDQVGGEGSTLSELVIDEFDEEQVWAGIELQNQSSLSKWRQG